jgi:REP element-mobilizing transposase RayT
VIYFVTVCTAGRRECLADPQVHSLLREIWLTHDRYRVGRYVLMPDHLHFFCAPGTWPPENLGGWMRFWKSAAARRWPGGPQPSPWQRDFWDTQLRQGESYTGKWHYVCENPVRAGLASRAENWPYQGEIFPLLWHD